MTGTQVTTTAPILTVSFDFDSEALTEKLGQAKGPLTVVAQASVPAARAATVFLPVNFPVNFPVRAGSDGPRDAAYLTACIEAVRVVLSDMGATVDVEKARYTLELGRIQIDLPVTSWWAAQHLAGALPSTASAAVAISDTAIAQWAAAARRYLAVYPQYKAASRERREDDRRTVGAVLAECAQIDTDAPAEHLAYVCALYGAAERAVDTQKREGNVSDSDRQAAIGALWDFSSYLGRLRHPRRLPTISRHEPVPRTASQQKENRMSCVKDVVASIEDEIEARQVASGTRMTEAEVNALIEQMYAEAIVGALSRR